MQLGLGRAPFVNLAPRQTAQGYQCRIFSPRQSRARPTSQVCLAQAQPLDYKQAGVDIDAGAELVRRIQKLNPSIGGFSGLVPFGTVLVQLFVEPCK